MVKRFTWNGYNIKKVYNVNNGSIYFIISSLTIGIDKSYVEDYWLKNRFN